MNIVSLFLNILLFLVPLILFPFTSEVFEFNKIVLVYLFTVLIIATWVINMILKKKIIFRRTILDIPILLFLCSQILSTIFSIDQRTSFFGYYSRFNGGLLSTLSYSLLYWAWVSNMNYKKTIKAIKILLTSAIIVSVYGALERLGIDKKAWIQDVQNRVFSTLGQPNWLAAWLVALIPFPLVFVLKLKEKSKKQYWIGVFSLFFLVLLFTKSRSGILGFIVSFSLFWFLAFKKELTKLKIKTVFKNENFKTFKVASIIVFCTVIIIGTPWTKGVMSIFEKQTKKSSDNQQVISPALERGGTESGEIRKIVWKGAVDIWLNNLAFGSGVETFAFSYYKYRPVEHNLTSEWEFLYNKAHNEYLNILATTGIVGFLSYSTFIVFVIIQIKKEIHDKNKRKNLLINYALISGFSSILITNFFGFSVVPVSLLFFLFPSMSVSLSKNKFSPLFEKSFKNLKIGKKILFGIVSITALYLLLLLSKYWYQDILFAKGKYYLSHDNPEKARELLLKTIKYSKKEALYWDKLSNATTDYVVSLFESDQENNPEKLSELTDNAIAENMKAESLSPANVNILRDQSVMYIKLSIFNPDYLLSAEDSIRKAIVLAPTDAKLYYNLGLTLVRMGRLNEAKDVFEKTIGMKSNYVLARFALGIVLSDLGEKQNAIKELQYILDNLDPNNKLVKQQLEEIQ